MPNKDNNWKIIRESDDPLALRLSIGSPHGFDTKENGYIVYRGETQECIELLEIALEEFKKHLQAQGE